jgi:HD superfamily phosphodiesterase
MRDTTKSVHRRIKAMVLPLWTPNAACGHGFDHAERVYSRAVAWAALDGIEPLAVGASAYLMDAGINAMGRSDHVARGITIAQDVIGRIPEIASCRETVNECIRYHEAETDVPCGVSREALILHDSDTLDRMGFTGVAMTIAYGIWVKRRFSSPTDPLGTTRALDLASYTLDYIVYTRTLASRLLLPRAQAEAARKLRETEIFLSEIRTRCNHGLLLDHDHARAILTQVSGER